MLKRFIRNDKSSGNEKLKVKDEDAPENEEIEAKNEENLSAPSDPQTASEEDQSAPSDPQPENEEILSNEILEAASSAGEGNADPQEALDILGLLPPPLPPALWE